MTEETVPVRSQQITVDGARLHVEVRGAGSAIMLVGCPMNAAAFEPLAEQLAADHTVITTDPRGIKRSAVDDRNMAVTPEMLAEDYRQILQHLKLETSSMFGSSGGAVAALAFAQANPDMVDTVIAHEPPLEELLGDREQLRANTQDLVKTYLGGDIAGAWVKFFDGANIEMHPEGVAEWIDNRTDDQELADEQFFFANTLRPTTFWQPDLTALGQVADRIVIGVGADSAGQVCDRTANAMASLLGMTPTVFPGDHSGFVEHPESFAQQLRSILAVRSTREPR